MLTQSARRRLARLGVAGALVAASAVATPAAAEPASDGVLVHANDALIAVGGVQRYVGLFAAADGLPEVLTVTVERSAVTGFATVVPAEDTTGCTATGTVLSCATTATRLENDGLLLAVTAKGTAEPGDKGDLVFDLRQKDGPSVVTTRATVEVGAGVDLRAQDLWRTTAAPGETVRTPFGVANVGDTTVRETVLLLSTVPAPARRHGNCSYRELSGDQLTVCRFADEIPPGAAVQLDDSAGLRVAADSWAPSTQFGWALWFTPDDYEEFTASLPTDGWQRGAGRDLELVPATDTLARSLRQTDRTPWDNSTRVRIDVTGDQRADVAATGAHLPGAVGATVTARIGYVNNGPAMINTSGPGGIETRARVVVPDGVTVLTAPEQCAPGTGETPTGTHGEPGGRIYFCEWHEVTHKGDAVVLPFDLRVDELGGAPGAVQLRHYEVAEGERVADLNPKNDSAPLVIRAAGGNGGGDGGSLPITGGSTGLVAGIGGLLLAAGVGGYVLARRRSTRFVA
ncbi:LPXTG cell wall anchor domain-containing protein [Micromonospora coxensis]|uniref:LPXTG-motif cell wall anchor domain-containing protein n=1 Tax=Micromonospora coxensis TaxID=356852 RepID=A0A1C5ITC7_9ACTN|nr:LPXTG cell wall anchor domain-containing protein [Micromonospora coxensis]SCG61617.1 LPXTG-motif cell wall anchor domain-containing protein [Micromonospora coxensis]